MRDSSQANESQMARGPLLVVAGILALVVAAIGSVRAADGPAGGHDATTVSAQNANQPGNGGGVAGAPTDKDDDQTPSDDDDAPDDQATVNGQAAPEDEVAGSKDGDDELDPVRTKPQDIRDPIDLEDPAKFGVGLTARVADVEAVQGKARGPGEIAGPALRVTIRATNNSARSIPLDNTFVDMSYGKQRTPGIMLTGPGTKEFPESVAAGADATGIYVFNIPPKHRDRIQVTVTYAADVPTAVFAGPVR